jgi:regulator of sirC expression with transglutaminase-like and TPR domain
MLTNLKAIYAQEGDWRRALAAVDRILLLAPGALAEFRDRGGLHAKLGRPLEAIRDWETYLRGAPTAPDAAAVRGQLRALRQSRSVLN